MIFRRLCALTLVLAGSWAHADDSSNIACYFRSSDGATVTWQWGLQSNNAYYSFLGEWKTTPYTKIQKFFSTAASYNDLSSSCENARKPNTVLFAIFAATSNTGNNYPIVLNGSEISPSF